MIRASFLLPLVLAALPVAAQTQTPATPPPMETISVTGVGRVSLTPDRVSFTVGVETIAPSVTEAVQQNNRLTSEVTAALKKAGATEREIRTSNFSIFPQQDYQEGRPRPRIIGYQVVNNVTVTRSSTTDVGRLLQVAIEAGANQVHGVGFTVADQTRGRDQGLRLAFEDARQKAMHLAQAAGRTLGRALAITEGAAPQPPIPMYGKVAVAEARVGPVPVEQGTDEREFTISVVFELK